jgi:hypothetical protein
MTTTLSDDETLVLAAHRLTKLLRESTPGDPGWFVQPNDLIGGTCVMPLDITPASAAQDVHSVADFMNEADAALIVALRAAAPALLTVISDAIERQAQNFDEPIDSAALAIARSIIG